MYYGTEMNVLNFGFKRSVQAHGGITYAGTITVQAEAYSTQRLVSILEHLFKIDHGYV